MNYYELLKDNKYFEYFSVKQQHDLENLSREELLAFYAAERERMAPYLHYYENSFMNIQNFEIKLFNAFTAGDNLVIQEKIDGSQTHFIINESGFDAYSSKTILNEENHLQGFYFWCKDHYKQVPSIYYGLEIYGEWLVPHHCEYPANRYGELYIFDVKENGQYWSQDKVEQLTKDCRFTYAPVLAKCTFKSWKNLMEHVGKTKLGGVKGEGIVVKNQTILNSISKQFYVKIVVVEFQETNKSRHTIKTMDIKRVLEIEEQLLLAKSIVTLARVRKTVLKMIDYNELPANWKVLDTIDILKLVKPNVYKDCVKEEKDTVDKIGKIFGKHCNDLTLEHIKTLKEEPFNGNTTAIDFLNGLI